MISGVPLVLAAPGNESVGVVGAAGGMSMTSVTPGSPGLVRAGDLVWCLPAGITPRSLAITQLVVYKSMPVGQFVP